MLATALGQAPFSCVTTAAYRWARYADEEDAAARMLVKCPVAAYLEEVYAEGDFSQLGIGT